MNADWLSGEPVRMWMQPLADAPVVGSFITQEWAVYSVAWGGLLFDLCIGFLLCWRRNFVPAALATIGFHIINSLWLSIGTFPVFGILSLVLFAPPEKVRAVCEWATRLVTNAKEKTSNVPEIVTKKVPRAVAFVVALFVATQLVMPLRVNLYVGNASWHEFGHSFSWRMMLRQKTVVLHIDAGQVGEAVMEKHGLKLAPPQHNAMAKNPNFLHAYVQRLAEAENPLLSVPDWVLPLEAGFTIGNYERSEQERRAAIMSALQHYRSTTTLAGSPPQEP